MNTNPPPYLHAESLSPDPLYGRPTPRAGAPFWSLADIHPHRLVRARPDSRAVRRWADGLDLATDPGPVRFAASADGRVDFLLDFGTELEGELELAIEGSRHANVYVTFGESRPEAEVWGLPSQRWPATEHRHLARRGRHRLRFGARGFRMVRVLAHDCPKGLTLRRAVVHARLAFRERLGDFRCSDRRLQRVWQSSVYTARLCTREDTIWDGVKRDRHGWYGDARVTQLATDSVFLDPAPAEAMLLGLPTDAWCNGIPAYSFDAVAMLRQVILTCGAGRPAIPHIYERVRAMLGWAARSHARRDGRLARADGVTYFFDHAYLDWTPVPPGGRFEELSWLQLKYVEGLRSAADCAAWLGHEQDAAEFRSRARKLERRIRRLFRRDDGAFVHTLNRTGEQWATIADGVDYAATYVERRRLGPSGPSRHSCATAVLAGLVKGDRERAAVLRVLNDRRVQPVITTYFAFYEQWGRAACGDVRGALERMRDYTGEHLEANNCPTVWESYEPDVRDFRRWGLHDWPKSLCHGWGSGIVPLCQRFLLGIEPVEPGFAAVAIGPPPDVPWTYEATVPTPRGAITVRRERASGPTEYRLPKSMRLAGAVPAGAVLL